MNEHISQIVDHVFSCFEQKTPRIVFTPTVCVDQVVHVDDLSSERGKISGWQERLGGGAIHGAFVSASLGYRSSEFLGFLGETEIRLIHAMSESTHVRPVVGHVNAHTRRSLVLENGSRNQKFTTPPNFSPDALQALAQSVASRKLSGSDWIMACSFYPQIIFEIFDKAPNLFLDAGYNEERIKGRYLSQLIERIQSSSLSNFILAGNGFEIAKVAEELGLRTNSSIFFYGQAVADEIARKTGKRSSVVFHEPDHCTAFAAGDMVENWWVSTFEIEPKRSCNAGDTYNGAWLPAYAATGNFVAASIFGVVSTCKRLADDELPNRENVMQFLSRAKSKAADMRISPVDAAHLARAFIRAG